MQDKTVLSNCFGQHYLFSARRSISGGGRSVPKQEFLDLLSAERFLKNFGAGDTKYRRLAFSLTNLPSVGHSPMAVVAEQLWRGKIFVYALSSDYSNHSRKTPKVFLSKSNDNQYQFMTAEDALLEDGTRLVHVESLSDAKKILSSLGVNNDGLESIKALVPNGGSSLSSSADATTHITESLASGDVVVLNLGPRKSMIRREVFEDASMLAGAKPVSEAPEQAPWIEIKLLNEDGDAVADQEYLIKDTDGNEYKGTTDDRGIARVNEIPAGDCEISFADLEGWS